MGKLTWYWHRLRAMRADELWQHGRKKLRERADARHPIRPRPLDSSAAFPVLPARGDAPASVHETLRAERDAILQGRWRAFGHLELKVDDPPQWQRDYLAGRDLSTGASAFGLDHRRLPAGADIKLIWELSRWHELVRLAMAAYVLPDNTAADKCLEWLESWVEQNPPYCGWNWTSPLEAGLRLIQFAWIDALLSPPETSRSRLARLQAVRAQIVAPHAHYVWRHRSFGSSANNHRLGELAGMILAHVRWPAAPPSRPGLDLLQADWEKEVLAQFAPDGGNREQALRYHLFSWELCWQSRLALGAAQRRVSPAVDERLAHAAGFALAVGVEPADWPYGDSDDGFVTPFFAGKLSAGQAWHRWLAQRKEASGIDYWLGTPPPAQVGGQFVDREAGRLHFAHSGILVLETSAWKLRWDLSPLGYLATAAHGHLDALHVSLWHRGAPVIIDPGTGAYYGDLPLRNWLSSREAHNAPSPLGVASPVRRGPFLWTQHHQPPRYEPLAPDAHVGVLDLAACRVRRCVRRLPHERGWQVEDACESKNGAPVPFSVRWQFPPDSWVKQISERKFSVHFADVAVMVELDPSWSQVELVERDATGTIPGAGDNWDGWVSPAFRQVARAPCLKLAARPGAVPCLFRTTFQASDA